MLNKIKAGDGSVQHISEIPQEIKDLYKTVWEIKQKAILDHSIGRGHFVDQSQSTNLFMANPTIEKLSSMYMYAWENGLKTTYYLRSKSKTKINQLDSQSSTQGFKSDGPSLTTSDGPHHLIDLENPEICESCT